LSEKRKIINFPDLDGWRFVAFFSVFLFHASDTSVEHLKDHPVYTAVKRLASNGPLGVDFFFVLSGFLIIYLLIEEKRTTGRIDAKNFYIRRILRIFPLYYLCLFIGFVLLPLARAKMGQPPSGNPDWRYYVVFLSNLNEAVGNAVPGEATLGVLWSVCVEEQFYLTVPLILLVVATRWYPWVFAAAILISVIFRAFHTDDTLVLSRHTLSFVGNLAVGGLAAYYSVFSPRFKKFFEGLSPWAIRLLYLAVIAVFFFQAEIFSIA
jgi:peptidoglycan/LPS O-acetylase OafA/YrhL